METQLKELRQKLLSLIMAFKPATFRQFHGKIVGQLGKISDCGKLAEHPMFVWHDKNPIIGQFILQHRCKTPPSLGYSFKLRT